MKNNISIIAWGLLLALSIAVSGCSDSCKHYAPCCSELRKISCEGNKKCSDELAKLENNCNAITPSAQHCKKALPAIQKGLSTIGGSGVDVSAAKSSCTQ